MRSALWADAMLDEHRREIDMAIAGKAGRTATFVAFDRQEAIGFVEASLRHDYVNGCDTSPVAFLEGIYIRPDYRRLGIAGLLLGAVENWGRTIGCAELGSDTEWDNSVGQAFHSALGFEETERTVFFKKHL